MTKKIQNEIAEGRRKQHIAHSKNVSIETNQGLVLVDTGFGLRDVQSPDSRLSPFFIHFNNIQFERKYTAIEQIEQLGFSARDVRHIAIRPCP